MISAKKNWGRKEPKNKGENRYCRGNKKYVHKKNGMKTKIGKPRFSKWKI